MSVTPEQLIQLVLEQYIASGDFNGLPAYVATQRTGATLEALKAAVGELVSAGQAAVLFGDRHPNPHIRAFADEPIESQITKLKAFESPHFVIYPTPTILATEVDRTQYDGRPYSLALALGAPQLEYVSFDPIVLDSYRRDPRYRFQTDDIQGQLSVSDDAYESDSFPDKHKVILQSFAFSFAEDMKRAVAVFFTDLGRLSPEHQRVWAAYEVDGKYLMHPDAYRALVLGDWNLKVSLGDAFLEEMQTINRMCRLIGWRPLFIRVPERPKEFGFMLRPTRRELNDFVLLLDKLLSDNIDVAFFPTTIARESETIRPDGKIVVQKRGTIAMLEEWLNTAVRLPDPGPKDELLRELREIRKLRQKPAHAIDDDAHDPALFAEQRRLFLNGYDIVRTLRLMLANHPLAARAQDEMNEQVRLGEIWSV